MLTYIQTVEQLRKDSDTKYALFAKRISNTSCEVIGNPLPYLRKLAKQFKGYEQYVAHQFENNAYLETDLLKGIVISTAKIPLAQKTTLLDCFTPYIECWSTCDSTAMVCKEKKDIPLMWDYCNRLCSSQIVFERRFGVVLLIVNFCNEEYASPVLSLVDRLSYGDYYIDMAVAWLLSVLFVKCRQPVFDYLSGSNSLNKFTHNKAIQKIVESYRVSNEDKLMVKSMRIK